MLGSRVVGSFFEFVELFTGGVEPNRFTCLKSLFHILLSRALVASGCRICSSEILPNMKKKKENPNFNMKESH